MSDFGPSPLWDALGIWHAFRNWRVKLIAPGVYENVWTLEDPRPTEPPPAPQPDSGLRRLRKRIRPLFVRGAMPPAPSRDKRPIRYVDDAMKGPWRHHSAEREVRHRWHIERGEDCPECCGDEG